jgi:ACS family glucarate transporter-like MFS transporter
MNTGGQLGGFVTAWLTPMVAGRLGWTASFLVAAALCVVGAIAWLFVDPSASLTNPGITHSETRAVPESVVSGRAMV